MSELLNITKEHIEKLNDTELRELVGLLCESDYRVANLPTTSVTWGGHQDTPDGGVDVRVNSNRVLPESSNIPRSDTVFQVKKSDMPRGKMKDEIFYKGKIRESILNMISVGGAYIIVSGKASDTDSFLQKRQNEIRDLLVDYDQEGKLYTDYFDSSRIATWVRDHPPIIFWVRQTIKDNYQGWQPYGNWSKSPEGINDSYLIDDRINLSKGKHKIPREVNFISQIEKFRDGIRKERSITRLVGMSGVGKTRLIQALFESDVGNCPLSKQEVVYGDNGEELFPSPTSLLQQLNLNSHPTLLVVDNCTSRQHSILVGELKNAPSSKVRLLTIEHDLREDRPEDTDCFKLSTSSNELIFQLLKRRFPEIPHNSLWKIVRFSDGNSRVAIYLAKSLKKGESVTELNDNQLIERLFQWKDLPDDNLLETAEILSIVYSFNGEDTSSEQSELKFLTNLIGSDVKKVSRHISLLLEKEIMQKRAEWRALMPPALANKLALKAFGYLPVDTILSEFIDSKLDRLVSSLAHRMNHLKSHDVVKNMVNKWMSKEGFIDNKLEKDEWNTVNLLKYLAPIAPDLTLTAIEKKIEFSDREKFFSKKENQFSEEYIKILRLTCYLEQYFVRSVNLLMEFATQEKTYNQYNSVKDDIAYFFNPYSSKTRTSHSTREFYFQSLISNYDPQKKKVIKEILSEALSYAEYARYSNYDVDLSTDLPFNRPQSEEQEILWYTSFLTVARDTIFENKDIAEDFREVLVKQFRELWTRRKMDVVLFGVIKEIHDYSPWNEMWAEVLLCNKLDFKKLTNEPKDRLIELKDYLEPKDLKQLIRAFTIIDNNKYVGIDEEDETGKIGRRELSERNKSRVIGFGEELASRNDLLEELLVEMVQSRNSKIADLGFGLASRTEDPLATWELFKEELVKHINNEWCPIVRGFIKYLRLNNIKSFNYIMDEVLVTPLLNQYLVLFQLVGPLEEKGYQRLIKDLDNPKINIYQYYHLFWKNDVQEVGEKKFLELVKKIGYFKEGSCIAVDILSYRISMHENYSEPLSQLFVNTVYLIVEKYSFDGKFFGGRDIDASLSLMIAPMLEPNKDSIRVVKNLFQRFCKGVREDKIKNDFNTTIGTIRSKFPQVFLDVLYLKENRDNYRIKSTIGSSFSWKNTLFNKLSDENLLAWCKKEAGNSRMEFILERIDLFISPKENIKIDWKRIVYSSLKEYELTETLLKIMEKPFRPSSWTSGTLSNILESRKPLLETLTKHNNKKVNSWAKHKLVWLNGKIDNVKEQEYEMSFQDRSNQSFE